MIAFDQTPSLFEYECITVKHPIFKIQISNKMQTIKIKIILLLLLKSILNVVNCTVYKYYINKNIYLKFYKQKF